MAPEFGPDSVRVIVDGGDSADLKFEAVGRGDDRAPAPAMVAPPRVEGATVLYARAEETTEWYISSPLGLEQGFDLTNRPPGAEGEVTLSVGVYGALAPSLRDDLVALVDEAGTTRAFYGGLHVVDSTGASLPSWLEVADRTILLRFDDGAATYPVVVDPLVWTQQKLLSSDGMNQDRFGRSVSIWSDVAFVGASGADTPASFYGGAVYVFGKVGGVWTEKQKLIPPPLTKEFGRSVAISGNTALVGTDTFGAGGVHVYTEMGPIWTPEAVLTTANDVGAFVEFGCAVSLFDDTAMVGSYGDDALGTNAGAAYAFERVGGVWTEQQKLAAAETTTDDEFGAAVNVWGDTLIVGAPETDDNGSNTGAAYIFVRSGNLWVEQQKLMASDSAAGDRFGYSVGVWGDTAVVGSIGADGPNFGNGAAYIFVRDGTTWSQQARLVAMDAGSVDALGSAVSLVGETLLVGAPSFGAGKAYLFERNGSTWAQQGKFTAADFGNSDHFGEAVALDNQQFMVGMPQDSTFAFNRGSVYAFQLEFFSENGSPCSASGECLSASCVDGVCCDTTCGNGATDDCQRCDVPASVGTCKPAPSGETCREAVGICDEPEACDGVDVSCPSDVTSTAAKVCRASEHPCDVTETCDGTSTACPRDGLMPDGSRCDGGAGECVGGECSPSGEGGAGGSSGGGLVGGSSTSGAGGFGGVNGTGATGGVIGVAGTGGAPLAEDGSEGFVASGCGCRIVHRRDAWCSSTLLLGLALWLRRRRRG